MSEQHYFYKMDLNVKVLTRRFKRLFEGLQANIKAKTSISKRGKDNDSK